MRKKYEKPCMNMENFEANEYIAACYHVTCNVPHLKGVITGNLSEKSSGYAILDGSYNKLHGYGCGKSHVIKTEGDTKPRSNGWWTMKDKFDGLVPNERYNGRVYVWKDGIGKNTHFAKNGTWIEHQRPNHS